MQKSKVTYIKGMNQDLSKSKYQPGHFYDGKNLKIVTEDGLTTGSIVNKKGNELSFKVPTVPAQTINGVNIPEQSDLHIIGFGEVKDYIILFTTNNHQDEPTSSVGQVWKIEYKDSSSTPEDLINGELDVNTHLVYNNYVNFSTKHPIGDEVVGRYETIDIIRIYWTDFYNTLRTLNIADPEASLIEPDKLGLKPDIIFSQPIITGLGTGNVPAGSMVQIAYRLISDNGIQTPIGPASVLIPVTEYDETTLDREDFSGSSKGRDTNRSVEFKINDIDTEFDIIELFAVVYEDLDAPTIYKFGESNLSSSGVYTGSYTGGTQNILEITTQEYNMTNIGFDKCKSISYKDNRLVAGNVYTREVDIDFDARAYRFNGSGQSYLKNDADSPIPGSLNTSDYLLITSPNDAVPEEHDCFNVYNIEDRTANPLYPTQNQFKYKSNGFTIGGEGPNVSYEFVTDELLLDDDTGEDFASITTGNNTVPHHYQGNLRRGAGDTLSNDMYSINGSDNTIPLDGQWRDFQSPILHAYRAGYKRGEVYRFGIQFLTKEGLPTFVKWVGDVKFPDPSDNPGVYGLVDPLNADAAKQYTSGDPTVTTYGKTMGIKFSVNFSSISDNISGFRIVRSERTVSDMTRIGTGALAGLNVFSGQANSFYGDALTFFDGAATLSVGLGNQVLMNPMPSKTTLNDLKNHYNFISPLSLSMGNIIGDSDGTYLKTSSEIRGKLLTFYAKDAGNQKVGMYFKAKDYQQSNFRIKNIDFRYRIKRTEDLRPGTYIAANFPINGLSRNYLHTSYAIDVGTSNVDIPLALGTNCWQFYLEENDTSDNEFGNPSQIYYDDYAGFQGIASQAYNGFLKDFNGSTTGDGDFYLPLFDYSKFVTTQYGGASFEAISKTSYISTGHYQPFKAAAIPTSLTFDVYGGDTFVTYYDAEIYQPYYRGSQNGVENAGDKYPEPSSNGENRMSVGWFFPVETPYNPMLRTGRHFSHYRDAASFDTYPGDSGSYNTVYAQENNGEQKFFAKDFLATFVEEFPNRLWVSQNKINGELIDSWRMFKDANFLDVEGTYGDINKVVNFRDNIFFLQDRAVGNALINQRSLIQDSTGVQLSLGTGGVIDDFGYISTTSGTKDQFSVSQTNTSLYYYDRLNEKIYRIAGDGNLPISDVQGMHSFFRKLDNKIYSQEVSTGVSAFTDTTSISERYRSAGVHSVYDKKNNVILFTFLNPFEGALPAVPKGETLQPFTDGFTIAYNENINAFESFYDFIPTLYKEHKGNPISVNPSDRSTVYLHNEGNRGEFYGQEYPTQITTLFNPSPDSVKVFNNLEWNSEVSDANGVDLDETMDTMQAYNEYQDSGVINLIASNLKKRMRTWRMYFPRDSKARMRSQSVFVKFTKNNNNNKRFVLHDLIISFFNKMF